MRSKKVQQNLAFSFMWLCGGIAILALLAIIIYVVVSGVSGINWEFLSTNPKGGLGESGGIFSILKSTALLLGGTLIILAPVGLLASIYLSEYAPNNKFTAIIRYGIDTLAGIPSIVFGLFALVVLIFFIGLPLSITAGALVLVCLLLPTMIRVGEEALKSVPQEARQASLALGATKWQTIYKVVLPTAIPGILTAVILCTGRALGETACLFVVMGSVLKEPNSFMDPGRSLALHIFYTAMEKGDFKTAMATATILIIIILVINVATNIISARFRKKMGVNRY
ncbi:MAG: phosphate ABC transporter permease PstA [Chloroflexi bacterium]|nr:phosphate ABC transporter permease PstA [Chloroflexota bacterium]